MPEQEDICLQVVLGWATALQLIPQLGNTAEDYFQADFGYVHIIRFSF